jgi:16S rRNA (cytosine1402-N4)-methyltransferase
MLREVTDALKIKRNGVYFDGTLGGGGFSESIMLNGGRVIATDLDDDAIEFARGRFESNPSFAGKFRLIKGNYKELLKILEVEGLGDLDGAVLDLGISSHQVDEAERGFSYMKDAPLDMRMDRTQSVSAYTIVNGYPENELSRIIYDYGEERAARRISAAIVEARKKQPIRTTGKLAEIILNCVPFISKGGHPAKRAFMALRAAVNGELEGLDTAVYDIVRVLKSESRLCVLTFNSLEDRIIKRAFKQTSTDCICDKSLPICVCNHKAETVPINKGVKASETERRRNSRSESATLRIIEKI